MIRFNSKCFLKCFYSIKFLLNQSVALVVLFLPGCSGSILFSHQKTLEKLHQWHCPKDMKDLCITREQSTGIHDVVNDQGLPMHYTAISNKVFWCESLNTAKGWIDFFSLCWSKDFQCGFLEGHNVWENNCYWSSNTEMWLWRLN